MTPLERGPVCRPTADDQRGLPREEHLARDAGRVDHLDFAFLLARRLGSCGKVLVVLRSEQAARETRHRHELRGSLSRWCSTMARSSWLVLNIAAGVGFIAASKSGTLHE